MKDDRRERITTMDNIGPYKARVTIDALKPRRGRATFLNQPTLFEVGTEWTGPPMAGMPPADGPVQARDIVLVTDELSARRVARIAAEDLRNGHVPDLRKLAGSDSAGITTARALL